MEYFIKPAAKVSRTCAPLIHRCICSFSEYKLTPGISWIHIYSIPNRCFEPWVSFYARLLANDSTILPIDFQTSKRLFVAIYACRLRNINTEFNRFKDNFDIKII